LFRLGCAEIPDNSSRTNSHWLFRDCTAQKEIPVNSNRMHLLSDLSKEKTMLDDATVTELNRFAADNEIWG
jgi:hypothetical protein